MHQGRLPLTNRSGNHTPTSSTAIPIGDIREDVANLRSAVDVALRAAHEALQLVQQQQQLTGSEGSASRGSASPPQSCLSENALREHLHAFEAYIIRRVREETARVVECAHPHDNANSKQTNLQAATTLGRRVELQLEVQRTRSAAAEQRLAQLESKLNALMTDVVAQSQRESVHRKQLAEMVHEKVDAEMLVVAASVERAVHQQTAAALHTREDTSTAAMAGLEDVSVMQHVTAALAAIHERVEEQHAEFTHWQQQQYDLMEAMAAQINQVKEKNATLWQLVHRLRQQP